VKSHQSLLGFFIYFFSGMEGGVADWFAAWVSFLSLVEKRVSML
jgi:hypothetical protein